MSGHGPVVVCVASYEKGQACIEAISAAGCRVVLLTAQKLRDAAWPWHAIAETHTFSDIPTPDEVLRLVQRLARSHSICRIVALDEFDQEAAALVREELRLPGMGQSATRFFRDKLAMRVRARLAGIAVPEFTATWNDDDLHTFVNGTRGPWLLKPRSSASAIGIRRIGNEEELWRALHEIGEARPGFLLERFLPGRVFHVDSVWWQGQVLLQAAHGYGATPMSLMQSGGVFTTETLARDSAEAVALKRMDRQLLQSLGMQSGVTHTEFIQAEEDGAFYFLETAARVGGAYIAELVECSTGANPWREWGRIEAALTLGTEYRLPAQQALYAGSVICLARQETPDLSAYVEEEIVLRLKKHHHAGLIVRSSSAGRVAELVSSYRSRFERDFLASMPAPDRPTS